VQRSNQPINSSWRSPVVPTPTLKQAQTAVGALLRELA
jgi:hypothetical protein